MHRHLLLTLLGTCLLAQAATAGDRYPRRRPRAFVPAASARTGPAPVLGTFYPEPYLNVRGDHQRGGFGYSAFGMYGANQSLDVYGPLSAFRSTTAPVTVYSRGYDGLIRPGIGSTATTPNLPRLSPYVYPTRANFRGGFPPDSPASTWPSTINVLDLN